MLVTNSHSNKGKIIKSKSRWQNPYIDNPSDKLKIRLLLDEQIKGNRIIGLEAKILPGDVHRLHIHLNEFVLVYSIKGRCKVTVGKTIKTISPKTMIFIPPKVPHRFENKSTIAWEGIAFAIGTKRKIKNIWLKEK